jgi:hypothetical protein
VCGRIVAYQLGNPDGFGNINPREIDDAYVDGISITFGDPRNHIWTFAALKIGHNDCPCVTSGKAAPPFVSQDHFCEVGAQNDEIDFLDNNPLWDGQGCAGPSTCCEFNNPPTFCKQLDQPTTEDIEIRIMGSVYTSESNAREDEDTPVELIEIFVQ